MAEHEPPPEPLTIVLPPVLDGTAELPAVSPSAAPVLALPGPAPRDAQAPRPGWFLVAAGAGVAVAVAGPALAALPGSRRHAPRLLPAPASVRDVTPSLA
jgi:hypothetical protein